MGYSPQGHKRVGHDLKTQLPSDSVSKESACNAEDPGLMPGSGRSPGEGNGNPLQCSCLGNPMGRGAWRATVRGVAKHLDTTEHICAHSVINAVF